MSTAILPMSLNFYLPVQPHFLKLSSVASVSKPHICFATSSQSEEARWLREEQRWQREEQRWLREESRWNAERQSLLCQIQALTLRIHDLEQERVNPPVNGETSIAKLLQILKEGDLGKNINRIPESGSSALPLVVEAATPKEEVPVVKEVIEVSGKVDKHTSKKPLRKGSQGDEVQAMQEALLKLGFYSGEEDMEFSSFSIGTERAVRTWQASLGAKEDGIMTSELLERLYTQEKVGNPSLTINNLKESNEASIQEKKANGAPIASITEISEVQQTVIEESGSEFEISQRRVFLLGENRWEEPSRLNASKKRGVGKSSMGGASKKCLSCHGEGRIICMECDGTGEPNLEPQFLAWVDEGSKCPYCEGLGYIKCDVCEGKNVVEA